MRPLSNLSKLGCHVTQLPSGRFHLVGRVPAELAYRYDGDDMTLDEALELAKLSGPGFVRSLKPVSYASAEEAAAALANWNAAHA